MERWKRAPINFTARQLNENIAAESDVEWCVWFSNNGVWYRVSDYQTITEAQRALRVNGQIKVVRESDKQEVVYGVLRG